MKNAHKITIVVALILIFLFAVVNTTSEAVYYEAKNVPEMTKIAPVVIETPKVDPETLLPALKRICACESVGDPNAEPQHFESDGVTVLTGRLNNNDIGLCQISTTYWLDVAKELGYDIYTEQGNIAMANYIYEYNGSQPWFWSQHCWK